MTQSVGGEVEQIHELDAQLRSDALSHLRRFLSIISPADLIDDEAAPLPDSDSELREAPLSAWTKLHSTPTLNIVRHPTMPLFSISSFLSGVTVEQFWTLMASIENRKLWDASCESGHVVRWLDGLGSLKQALRVEEMRFGSVFMVAKPRCLRLLSVDVQLASTADSPMRLASISASTRGPAPPKGYTQFELGIGGFLVEAIPAQDGIRVTQLSDLGEVAAWVPQSVVKLVSATLVPRSLANIAKIAKRLGENPILTGETSKYREDMEADPLIEVSGGALWHRERLLPPLVHTCLAELQPERLAQPASSCSPLEPTQLGDQMSAPHRRAHSRSISSALSKSTQPSGSSFTLTLQRLSTRLSSSFRSPSTSPKELRRGASEGAEGYPFPSCPTPAKSRPAFLRSKSGLSATSTDMSVSVSTMQDLCRTWEESASLGGSETVPGTPIDETMARSGQLAGVEEVDTSAEENSPDPGALGLSSDEELVRPLTSKLRHSHVEQHTIDAHWKRLTLALAPGERPPDPQAISSGAWAPESSSVAPMGSETHRTATSDANTAQASEIPELLADALQTSLLPFDGRRRSRRLDRRMSRAERDAQRLSNFLILGSDALSMVLAPAARQSIIERSTPLASSNLDPWQEDKDERSSSHGDDSDASKPSMLSASVLPPSLKKLGRAQSASSASVETAATHAFGHHDATISQAHPPNFGHSQGWSYSSIAEVPYAVALGLINLSYVALATAGRQSEPHSPDPAHGARRTSHSCPSNASAGLDHFAFAASSTHGTSAFAAPASPSQIFIAAEPARRSAYDPADSKLHPFPGSLGRKHAGVDLPPIGQHHYQYLERAAEVHSATKGEASTQYTQSSYLASSLNWIARSVYLR
ncbi:START-like domain [Ceraceosorus bombacis]|uniref:START-like domain n=1 Tax=Ceraceosorus bombacis TaxID=401625 RepID=A0A0P1BH95_9BASI|nr:START-like domain [Ceraceosorus bombacis]